MLQQYLPFTVLKLKYDRITICTFVATVLTVYGIETAIWLNTINYISYVATVLTVYGIETLILRIA